MLRKTLSKEDKVKIDRIKGPLKNALYPTFDSALSFFVISDEYAVVDEHHKQPILGSVATSCLLIGLYDKKQKRAGFAHATIKTNVDSLENLTRYFVPADTAVHLVGGNENIELCNEVIHFFEKREFIITNAHIDFAALDYLKVGVNLASFAIDARNGNIYTPVESILSQRHDSLSRLARSTRMAENQGMNPLIEILNTVKPREENKQNMSHHLPSFHGLAGGFLNKKSSDPIKTAHPTKTERMYPGLKAGFLK